MVCDAFDSDNGDVFCLFSCFLCMREKGTEIHIPLVFSFERVCILGRKSIFVLEIEGRYQYESS